MFMLVPNIWQVGSMLVTANISKPVLEQVLNFQLDSLAQTVNA
jgi:hypothetical protein